MSEAQKEIWRQEEARLRAALLLPAEEQMDARYPDLWYEWGQEGERMCYWCIGEAWHWRQLGKDGGVLASGTGRP